MKKTKLLICLTAMCLLSFQTFAGPSRGCPGRSCRPCYPCRPCPPPPPRPCRPCYYDCRTSSGVRLAADIVSLVGASLNVLRSPVAVAPVAVAPAPALVQTPVPCQPVYYNNGYVPMPPIYR